MIVLLSVVLAGIISACAEQTKQNAIYMTKPGDHLRVCGADDDTQAQVTMAGGSSPRVRSRRRACTRHTPNTGIISACAEQTPGVYAAYTEYWDHLRVCGADRGWRRLSVNRLGSSPRVRSRRVHRLRLRSSWGIISACAEQTDLNAVKSDLSRDHLRVCGADRPERGEV